MNRTAVVAIGGNSLGTWQRKRAGERLQILRIKAAACWEIGRILPSEQVAVLRECHVKIAGKIRAYLNGRGDG